MMTAITAQFACLLCYSCWQVAGRTSRFDSCRLNRKSNNRFVPTHISLARYGTTYGLKIRWTRCSRQSRKSKRDSKETYRPTTKQLSWPNQLLKASKAIRPDATSTEPSRAIFLFYFIFFFIFQVFTKAQKGKDNKSPTRVKGFTTKALEAHQMSMLLTTESLNGSSIVIRIQWVAKVCYSPI